MYRALSEIVLQCPPLDRPPRCGSKARLLPLKSNCDAPQPSSNFMKLRVKDLVTPPAYLLPGLTAPSEVPVERLFCDTQLRVTLRRILDHLTPGSISQAPVTLLAGEAHSGKSRLLRVVRALLRDPAGPAARKIFPDATVPST